MILAESNRGQEKSNSNSIESGVMKVAAHSDPKAVAGALAGVIREQGKAKLQAIGAGAINQAIKGIAISRGYVAPNGLDLVCTPAFIEIEIDGEERTAIQFMVEPL